jgi:hypothetical protein
MRAMATQVFERGGIMEEVGTVGAGYSDWAGHAGERRLSDVT